MNSSSNTKSKLGFWRVFSVSVACYLPAVLIVLLSHFLFGLGKQTSQGVSGSVQPLTDMQKNQIAMEVKKVLDQQPQEVKQARVQQAAISEVQTSIVAKEYIDGRIEQAAKAQAEQAAKDEIDRLRADWKGDLFGQIAFPVVFAIASIFAAFAVKDILTEVLKEQERDKLKQEIEQELYNTVVPEAIEVSQAEINECIKAIESYAYLLEYQMAGILINQLLDSQHKTLNHASEDCKKNNQLVIEKLLGREITSLLVISGKLRDKDWTVIKEAERLTLTTQIRCAKLDKSSEVRLLEKLPEETQDEKKDEDPYQRIDDLIEVQLRLLVTTLSKPFENETEGERLEKQEMINDLITYLSSDARREPAKSLSKYWSYNPIKPWRRN